MIKPLEDLLKEEGFREYNNMWMIRESRGDGLEFRVSGKWTKRLISAIDNTIFLPSKLYFAARRALRKLRGKPTSRPREFDLYHKESKTLLTSVEEENIERLVAKYERIKDESSLKNAFRPAYEFIQREIAACSLLGGSFGIQVASMAMYPDASAFSYIVLNILTGVIAGNMVFMTDTHSTYKDSQIYNFLSKKKAKTKDGIFLWDNYAYASLAAAALLPLVLYAGTLGYDLKHRKDYVRSLNARAVSQERASPEMLLLFENSKAKLIESADDPDFKEIFCDMFKAMFGVEYDAKALPLRVMPKEPYNKTYPQESAGIIQTQPLVISLKPNGLLSLLDTGFHEVGHALDKRAHTITLLSDPVEEDTRAELIASAGNYLWRAIAANRYGSFDIANLDSTKQSIPEQSGERESLGGFVEDINEVSMRYREALTIPADRWMEELSRLDKHEVARIQLEYLKKIFDDPLELLNYVINHDQKDIEETILRHNPAMRELFESYSKVDATSLTVKADPYVSSYRWLLGTEDRPFHGVSAFDTLSFSYRGLPPIQWFIAGNRMDACFQLDYSGAAESQKVALGVFADIDIYDPVVRLINDAAAELRKNADRELAIAGDAASSSQIILNRDNDEAVLSINDKMAFYYMQGKPGTVFVYLESIAGRISIEDGKIDCRYPLPRNFEQAVVSFQNRAAKMFNDR